MATKEEFWNILGPYGAQIWPIQIIFFVMAILLVGGSGSNRRSQSLFAKLFLALAFAWNGILFYKTLAKGMAGNSQGNYFLGSLFILVAALFAVDLFQAKDAVYFANRRMATVYDTILDGIGFCYPLFGILSGHGLTT